MVTELVVWSFEGREQKGKKLGNKFFDVQLFYLLFGYFLVNEIQNSLHYLFSINNSKIFKKALLLSSALYLCALFIESKLKKKKKKRHLTTITK